MDPSTLEVEIEVHHSLVPDNASPEVRSPIIIQSNEIDTLVGYNLPFKHNQGKPLNRYSPDVKEQRSKFPIANYMSTKKLPKPLKKIVR